MTARFPMGIVAAALLVSLGAIDSFADAGTALTYQGVLKQGGSPLDDSADFRFTLWDAEQGGEQIGPIVAKNAVNVVDGLFTSLLDFGVEPYTTNEGRWLQIMVRSPRGQGQFQSLTPRQKLTPTPFSLTTRGINVSAGGNVGIGTTNPNADLNIVGDGTGHIMRVTNGGRCADQTNTALIVADVCGQGKAASFYGVTSNQLVQIQNDGAGPALTVSGNVGIGRSDPAVRLHVDGGTDASPGNPTSGYFLMGDSDGVNIVMDNNEIMARTDSAPSTLYLNNEGGDVRIGQNGGSTTVYVPVLAISGADLAEKFPVSEKVTPGTVVEIDPENAGKLRTARGAYNRRVAGVVSGAGDLPAGAILGNLPGYENAPPIALSGRVWVKCDASRSAIQIGDLLTTADKAGCAMAVADQMRASGATLGKAMTSLDKGEAGLVLVLVNLQ